MRISDWSSDVCSSDLEFAGYEQPPRSQLSQDLVEIRFGKGKTAFAPAKLAMFPNHLRPDIPGAVDHNRPRLRMAVRGVHSLQQHGTTVLAGVIIAGQVSRSEERRGGKEWVSKFGSRWSAENLKKQK